MTWTRTWRGALVLVATLMLAGAPSVGPAKGQTGSGSEAAGDAAVEQAPAMPRLSAGEVAARVEAAGYGEVHSVQFEHGRFEVDARDKKGRRVTVLVDPETGVVRSAKFVDESTPRSVVPIENIVESVKAAGFHSVHFVEQEHALYEVHARDDTGRMVELFVHPKTGEVLRHPKTGEPLWKYVPEEMPFEPTLTVEQVVEMVEQAGYRDVYAVTHAHTLYEVHAHDAEGKPVTLHVDPKTGNVWLEH